MAKPADLAVGAQRAFGFPGRAAGVIQYRDIVGTSQATRRRGAHGHDPGQQIDAVAGGAEREDRAQVGCPGGEITAAIPERIGVNDQNLCFRILDLEQLIVERAQRMQPGDREPRQLRGDAGAPGVGAVGGEERHARARLQAQLHEHLLDAADQFGGAGDR